MPQRFNPPPNWPRAPEGWTPPPGWRPPASWGPAPPGWPFWIEVEPERRSHRVRTAIFGLLCVAGVGAIGVVAATIGQDSEPVAAEYAHDRAGASGSDGEPDDAPNQPQTGRDAPSDDGQGRQPGRALEPDRAEESTPFTPYRYYADCDVAKEAGAAPLHEGDPGYRTELDPDRDGIACDR